MKSEGNLTVFPIFRDFPAFPVKKYHSFRIQGKIKRLLKNKIKSRVVWSFPDYSYQIKSNHVIKKNIGNRLIP